MLIRLFALIGTAGTVLTVWGTQLWRSAAVFWQIPLLWLAGFVIGFLLYVLVVGVMALRVDPRRPVDRFHPAYYRAVVWTAEMVTMLARVRLHVIGEERLPKDRSFLMVSNHLSLLDPLVCLSRFRDWPTAYISKPENFAIPIVGKVIHQCFFLPIDRENARHAMGTIRQAADLLSAGTVNVAVYPEGTRSKTGELQEFHNGVLKAAQKAKVPIAVVAVHNTDKAFKRTPWRRTDVYVEVAAVLPYESFEGQNTAAIAQTVREKMEASLRRLKEAEKAEK